MPTQEADSTPTARTVSVKVLNQEHPERSVNTLTRMRALAEGGELWHALKSEWLPKNAVEPDDFYQSRLKLAIYENEVGPLLKQLNAHLFSEDLTVKGLPEEDYWPRFLQDVDSSGSSLTTFYSAVCEHALVGRRAFVWVNLPRRATPVANRADEERAGYLDAFLSMLTPEQVINWSVGDRGTGLEYVVIRDCVFEQKGPLSPRVRKWRWTVIDRTQILRYVYTPALGRESHEPIDTDQATLESAFDHKAGFCPVVMLELPVGLWVMRQVYDRAVGLTRASNDLSWALHQAANELLTITQRASSTTSNVTLGHGHYLLLHRDDIGTDAAEYIAPSGVAFDALHKNEKERREGLYRSLQAMASAGGTDSSRVSQSGESKALDWQAMDIVLSAYSALVKTCVKTTLEFVLRIRALNDKAGQEAVDAMSVDGLESWATEDLMVFLEACALATEAKRASPAFVQEVALAQARRLLSGQITPERMGEIEAQILAYKPATGTGYEAQDTPSGDAKAEGAEPEDAEDGPTGESVEDAEDEGEDNANAGS